MTATVDEAAQALSSMRRDDMIAAIEKAVTSIDRAHGPDAGVLLRLALDEERHVEALAGRPLRVHTLVSSAFRDIQIKVEARRAILAVDMLDSSAVAELFGASSDRRDTASDLRRRGKVIGVPVSGRKYVFPAFQFDPVARTLVKTVATINVHLDAKDDPWGVTSWWISAHPRLDGNAPKDLLGTDREADLLTVAGVRPAA